MARQIARNGPDPYQGSINWPSLIRPNTFIPTWSRLKWMNVAVTSRQTSPCRTSAQVMSPNRCPTCDETASGLANPPAGAAIPLCAWTRCMSANTTTHDAARVQVAGHSRTSSASTAASPSVATQAASSSARRIAANRSASSVLASTASVPAVVMAGSSGTQVLHPSCSGVTASGQGSGRR